MIAQLAHGWRKTQQCCAHAEKSVIHMIGLLISVSHWPIMMIGTGGLLLVVPNLCGVPASV
jgi:hypothetical protein